MQIKFLLSASVFLCSFSLLAREKKKWDVNNPEGIYKEVSFPVNEGTWMNLDVAPDGNEIVFDLLGDIYSVSSAGGGDNCWVMDRDRKNAKQITKEDFRLLNNAV